MLFISAILWTVITSTVRCKDIYTNVVILGAGAAGISAAKTLTQSNVHDFIIIDAQSFIGGRVQHEQFGSSLVELGANWIYGKGRNPVYKLAMKHGLKTTPNDKTNLVYFDHLGKLENQTKGDILYNEFEQVKIQLVDYAEKRRKHNQVDLSSRSALNLIGWKPNTPLKSAIEYFNIDWEFSEPAEMCSLEYATGTVDTISGTYPNGNEFVVDERGFNHILKEEAKKFLLPLNRDDSRLMLNTLVTKVVYRDHNVTVFTMNGDRIIANYAICTFSLGVLQSDDVEFDPVFPEWKREALSSFHMTTYTKIFLRFKEKFWQDWQFALYAHNVTRGYFTVWQNLNAPGYLLQNNKRDHILMVTVTDIESQRIESMTTTQVKERVMQVLKLMFNNTTIEEPIDILFPRWYQHPLFRGSYSNWPIGASNKHHMNMRAPLNNRLWFAGEAMSADYYGFLHGAWLEGKSVAQSILQCINDICPYTQNYEYVTGCDEQQQQQKPAFLYQPSLW